MRFALPEFLYALPVVWLVLGVLFQQARRRRRTLLARFAGPERSTWSDVGFSTRRRGWDAALWFLAATALCVALARPMYFELDDRSELQGAPYVIALDASRSMLAGDVKPTRYSAVTNALDRFFAETRGDRIGLITFSGVGYLNAPLTFDTTALRTILSYINPNALTDPGSSIGSALDRAARFFTSNALPRRTLVLISDGEDLDGQSLSLAHKLHREHNITVHTIGVGTATGARIPAFRGGGAVTNSSGHQVVTKLDENNLRRIANAAGGRYYRLGLDGEGLRQLREEVLRPLAEKEARDDLKNYREAYWWPLIVALLAVLVRLLVGAERFARRRVLPNILGANT